MGTSVRALLAETGTWVRRNWLRTLIFSVISFVICWGWNIWLLARAAGGGGSDDVAQTDSVATSAGGSSLNGIYWLVVSSIGFGLFTYGRERGFANAFGDLLRLPKSIAQSVSKSPAGSLAMLLWGMVIGLGIGSFMPSALSGVLGAGFILLSLTPLAAILNNVLIRVFVGVTSANAPNLSFVLAGLAAPFLMMTGEATGLLLVKFADLSAAPALVGAVVCAGLAYVLGAAAGKAAPAAAFLVVLVVGLGVGGVLFAAGPAAADDGGWAECFDQETGLPCKGLDGIRVWWDTPGASELRGEARTGGLFGGAGAVVGATLGGLLGNVAKARRGWKLPGGGFGTEPVALSGQEAVDLLQSKGMLTPAGEGAYQWVGVDGADAASAKLEGADLGGGKAVRIAVDAPAGPDGLVRVDDAQVQAEVFQPKAGAEPAKTGFDLPPQGDAKVDPGGFADTKVPGGDAGATTSPLSGEGGPEVKSFDGPADPGAGGGKEVTADFSGGDAKVDPSGLGDSKVPATEAGAPRSALPGESGADVKSFDAPADPGAGGGRDVTADFSGGDAKVDPSGLGDSKGAGGEVQAKGAFAQQADAGAGGGKEVTADFSGGDAKVDPSGLGDSKSPGGEAGAPRSALPGESGAEAKSFDAPADPTAAGGGKDVTADFSGGDAKVDPSGLGESKVPGGEAGGAAFGAAG